ncbi:MAG: hypothetical protein ACRDSE_08455 [Pseudonocardiaceae bacterium]
MADIEVGPQSLRDAAKGSRELADELGAVEVTVVDRLKQAMPQSGPAINAHKVSSHWQDKFKHLTGALQKQADNLADAAAAYDAGERDKEADFDGILGPAPRETRFPGW